MLNQQPGAHYVLLPPPHRSGRSPVTRFQQWRKATMPSATYQLLPAFWAPALNRDYGWMGPMYAPAIKRREPQATGLVHDDSNIYLVIATARATYGHTAKLMHCRDLICRDPDYAAHRRKRLVLVLLCDECPRKDADFARRHRIRVITGEAANDRATRETALQRLAKRLVDPGAIGRRTHPRPHELSVPVDV
jgi:hypothetical protein